MQRTLDIRIRIVAVLSCLTVAISGCTGSSQRPQTPQLPAPGAPNPLPVLSLSGIVSNAGGEPLDRVTVAVGSRTTVTGEDGRFRFEELAEGGYTISLQSPAGDFDCRSIVVASGQTQYDFTLPNPAPGPRVTRVEPRLGSTGNPLGSQFSLRFSAPLDAASLEQADFRFSPEIGDVSYELEPDGTVLRIRPRLQLEAGTSITAELVGDIRSTSGTAFSKPVRWSFRTAAVDVSPPRLLAVSPANNSTGVPLNQRLRLEFNETLSSSQLSLTIDSIPFRAIAAQADGRYLTLTASQGWQANTAYQIAISNITDVSGNTATEVVAVNFTTGQQQALSRNIQPDWNRVSGQIVFASDRTGSMEIWLMNDDGSQSIQLTSAGLQAQRPTISQDGRRVAFQRRAANNLWDILVANLESNALDEPLVITPFDFSDVQPYFSRTLSNRIVFVSNRGQTTGLFIMNEDGSSPLEVDAAFALTSTEPAFHPLLDGQLLFSAFSGNERDVWRKSISVIDGTTVNTNLTAGRASDDHSPCWGPDASYFVYVSDFDGTPNLWIAEANGDFPRQVTSFTQAVSTPCVSPVAGDNSCLLSIEREDGGSDLILVSLTSGEVLRNLTAPEGIQQ